MSIARKLALLLALALTAMAAVSASASATTVSPAGVITGTADGALLEGTLTLTCTSTASLDVNQAGTAQITALAFSTCVDNSGTSCTVAVDNTDLGNDATSAATVTHVGGTDTGTTTLDAGATITANITCSAVTCTFNGDTTVTGTAHSSVGTTRGYLEMDNTALTTSFFCGSTGDWTAKYTADTTGSGTDTTLTIAA